MELSGHDHDTEARIQENFLRLEESFEKALCAGIEKGEISERYRPKALARFLTSSLQGLRVMSKTRPKRMVLRDIVKVTLSSLE